MRFLDSTGLRLVLELDGAARADSHVLCVIRGSDVVHRIFEVTQVAERLNFGELFGGDNHFALKVRGQSMIEDLIDDGDYVVIRKQETANNGERVVAMIDNEVTLKKFNRDNGEVRLDPANGTMKPIVVDPKSDARILGVLVGVLRKC